MTQNHSQKPSVQPPTAPLYSYVEEIYKEDVKLGFRCKEILFSKTSAFQKVEIVQTTGHGKLLLNDGCVMLSERDEFIYHEMMAHVPLLVHPSPRRVLIIGGGDGGTAREVLRHDGVEECVLVEIDEIVVQACREHLPQTAAVFQHPRLNLKIMDGVEYVRQQAEALVLNKFDVILIDSTDPVGPAQPLFGVEFYKNVRRLLSSTGIVISQGETPFYEPQVQSSLLKVLAQVFQIVMPYNFTNMTYPGGLWTFCWSSLGQHPLHDFNQERWKHLKINFNYYNEQIHQAAFALPTFMQKNISSLIKTENIEL